MIDVTGRVAKVIKIAAPCHVEHAPQRFARNADKKPWLCERSENIERGFGIFEMFDHFAANDEIGRVLSGLKIINIAHGERNAKAYHGGTRAGSGDPL